MGVKLHPIEKPALLRFQPGDQVGKLTVLEALGSKHFKRGVSVVFRCRCACGKEIQRDRQTLVSKKNLHCGCQNKMRGTAPPGLSRTMLYKRWAAMIDRCSNPSSSSYADYGGRGIAVCQRWLTGEDGETGFECFRADMGEPAHRSLTMERQNSDGEYSPANCEWASRTVQNRNRRSLRLVTYNGKTLSVAEWSEQTGIPYFTLSMRLRRGWSAERALTPSA